ncbi:MAG TPA: hypothetical protein VHJ54_00935 [Solirubrobacterales bacterium]|nr:hypothetical protein [Solirubrobacterales bacterium]
MTRKIAPKPRPTTIASILLWPNRQSLGLGHLLQRSCVDRDRVHVEGGDCAEAASVLQDWADTSAPSPGPEG